MSDWEENNTYVRVWYREGGVYGPQDDGSWNATGLYTSVSGRTPEEAEQRYRENPNVISRNENPMFVQGRRADVFVPDGHTWTVQPTDAPDWRALLAAIFEECDEPRSFSFPSGDAGGFDSLCTYCAFCGWGERYGGEPMKDEPHSPDCPWQKAREALMEDEER